MDDDDGSDIHPDIHPLFFDPDPVFPPANPLPLEPVHFVDTEGEGDALHVGRRGDIQRAGDEATAVAVEVVAGVGIDGGREIAVVQVGIGVRPVEAAVVRETAVTRWAAWARDGGVGPKRAGFERRDGGAALPGSPAGPADLLVKPMVVAQCPPGGSAHVASGDRTIEDGGGIRGLRTTLQDRHDDRLSPFFRVRPGGAGRALAKLGDREPCVAQLEGDGEVPLEPTQHGVRQYSGRDEADVVEILARIDRLIAGRDDRIPISEE